MAFSTEYNEYRRWDDFHFWFSGKADGWEAQSLSFVGAAKGFKVKEIRLHFSTAFASVEDFVVYTSSIKSSYFNTIWVSEPLNGTLDFVQFFSQPIEFFSDDQLVFNASMVSNINGYGLEVLGWAARG